MAFNTEKNLIDMRQTDSQSCLYSAMNPYSVYASNASQNAHAAQTEKLKMYTQEAMMNRLSTLTDSSLGHSFYPQSYPVAGNLNEPSNFQSISMAPYSGYGHFYGATLQALTPTVQMTTDYTGLLTASNTSKCQKQVHPFYWRKKGNSEPAEGMTRTRDKYRVVYTDKQRVGLEKAFKENKFITLEKKKEISKELDLSERQIKIWFQNRRAKERRQRRLTESEQTDQVTPDLSDPEVDEVANNTASVNAESNDDLLGVDLSSHNYPTLHSLEEPSAKSQCRYQQTGTKTRDFAAVPMMQQNQTAGRVPVSPSEWNQASAPMTTCNVSPFTANPDWNLLYRS